VLQRLTGAGNPGRPGIHASQGYSLQLATVTGSVDEGYTFSLNVPV